MSLGFVMVRGNPTSEHINAEVPSEGLAEGLRAIKGSFSYVA